MKTFQRIALPVALLIVLLSGCGNDHDAPAEPQGSGSDGTTMETVPGQETNAPQKGAVERFEYDDLQLEVSNVKEVKQDTLNDGGEPWTYDVFVLYPGAVVTVLNADMMDDASDGIPHADWAFDTSSGERLDIVDGMGPIEATSDILGVFDPESSVYVLRFEIY